jgi:DNA replication protein DnaC
MNEEALELERQKQILAEARQRNASHPMTLHRIKRDAETARKEEEGKRIAEARRKQHLAYMERKRHEELLPATIEKAALKHLHVGEMFDNAYPSYPHHLDTHAMRLANGFKKSPKCMFAFFGQTGTGKTYAGVNMMVEAMAKCAREQASVSVASSYDIKGMYVRSVDLSDSLRDYSAKKVIKQTKHLMMDDLRIKPAGLVTDAFITMIEDIIDYRYRHQLFTVITSNCSPEAFAEVYGDPVLSRLTQSAELGIVTGDDLRLSPLNG